MRRVLPAFTAVLFLLLGTTVYAATFTVTTTADTNDGTCDADCSFREAVAAAIAAATDDDIVFDSSVFSTSQTIILSGTEIVITPNGTLTITGPGASLLTIDGNASSRIISNEGGAVTTIFGIRFTGGNGVGTLNTGRGGALYNNASSLTIDSCVVADNTGVNGGGLNNAGAGTLTILNSLIAGNEALTSSGGGLQNFSTSTLIVDRSLFFNNTVNNTTGGGGAQLNGIVRISNTTFANNNSTAGDGGGISSNGADQLLTNVTFSGNTATGEGGGLNRRTTNVTMVVRNCIFAGNTATINPDVHTNATLTSVGNNIVGIMGTSGGWIGTDLLDTDPMLGPLADNGGFTQTFLPMPGSPAINAGQNCVTDLSCASDNPPFALTLDQRGLARLSEGTVDIGAVETAPGFATVSGSVQTTSGRPNQPVYVTISDGGAFEQTVRTNGFGRFVFVDVPTGASYTISAVSKGLGFGVENVDVNGDVAGVVITENVFSPQLGGKK
ncbi:MAG: CSLREA domain-containing protein [Acidobacteriota bacterium]|nr:MAG: CSLREA domain-containing protein [Acidobacteriota bacterium]